jgi:hypothetical protein
MTPPPDRGGCGNAGAVETTERFPPRLGNLAQSARFPHSHEPILVVYDERTRTKTTRTDRIPPGGR